jgi:hypothetical protein
VVGELCCIPAVVMYRFFFWSLFAHIGSGVWVVLSIGLAKGPVNPQCVSHRGNPVRHTAVPPPTVGYGRHP